MTEGRREEKESACVGEGEKSCRNVGGAQVERKKKGGQKLRRKIFFGTEKQTEGNPSAREQQGVGGRALPRKVTPYLRACVRACVPAVSTTQRQERENKTPASLPLSMQ